MAMGAWSKVGDNSEYSIALGEFAAELNRIRVDRISSEDNEADKVERVRVVKAEERDNYGSKIMVQPRISDIGFVGEKRDVYFYIIL